MIIVNRVLGVLGATLLLSIAMAAPAAAADYTMKIAFGTANDIQQQWADWYKERVEAQSKGRIKVEIYPRAVLGTGASMIQGTQLGTIQAYTSPTDFFAGIDERFGDFAIPEMFDSREQATKVITDPEVNREILTFGLDKGLRPVTIFLYSPSDYCAKKPLLNIDDFKGKKFRVNATPAERVRMRLLGASAVPMDLAEVIPGIEQGTIDGTMSGMAVYVNFKFIDVCKTIIETDDTMIISVGVLSEAWLKTLPPDLRKMVIEVGENMQVPLNQRAMEIEDEMIKRWKAMGGTLVKLPPAERARLHKVLEPVGEMVTKDKPRANAFYKLMKKVEAEKYSKY